MAADLVSGDGDDWKRRPHFTADRIAISRGPSGGPSGDEDEESKGPERFGGTQRSGDFPAVLEEDNEFSPMLRLRAQEKALTVASSPEQSHAVTPGPQVMPAYASIEVQNTGNQAAVLEQM
jgi:hypothetical protein